MENKATIAVLGGTGDLGSGMASIFARSGYRVVIGSRAKARADEAAVRQQVVELAIVAATRGVEAGALANSVAAEALTSVLIAINRRYKIPGAGIRITGLPPIEAR